MPDRDRLTGASDCNAISTWSPVGVGGQGAGRPRLSAHHIAYGRGLQDMGRQYARTCSTVAA